MPIYQFNCTGCGQSKDELMSYDDRKAGITCECGSQMEYEFSACHFKPSADGAHAGRMNKSGTPVGPLNPKTKAYQKRNDEANSKYYAPDQTFGQGSVKKFKELKRKEAKVQKDFERQHNK